MVNRQVPLSIGGRRTTRTFGILAEARALLPVRNLFLKKKDVRFGSIANFYNVYVLQSVSLKDKKCNVSLQSDDLNKLI